ncbi:hypothetical protein VNO80_15345 [Phaseolus coccineus]|uniref:Uncharacterized protein n=1 Tax=Phaseolus coccineus TaxID=3886 RepID=A0AAN9MNK1_PHACN
MACLASSTFTLPLRASPLNKGVHRHQLNFALDTLLSKATIRTAQKIRSSSSNKLTLSLKGSCHRCLMSCTRFLHEAYSYNLDVDYGTEIVISGYWVGPDADDGWGFVEAVLEMPWVPTLLHPRFSQEASSSMNASARATQ